MLITSCSILETCPSVLWLYFFFSLFLYRTCLIPLPVLSGLWGWRMCVLELPFPCWAPRIVSAWTCFCLGSFPSGFRIDFCLSFLSLCLLKFNFYCIFNIILLIIVYKGLCFLKLYIILFKIFLYLLFLFGFWWGNLVILEHFIFGCPRKLLGGRCFPTFVYDLIIFIVNCRQILKNI